ncbi:MAG TPA: DNA polymerase IV, partial [Clostridia bacterium]|nr:DNA polymerase IV [Clostridia bacterium]
RDNTLFYRQHQAQLGFFTQSPLELSLLANRLFKENYNLGVKVRSLTVRAIKLVPKARPEQLTLFEDAQKRAKRDKLDDAVEGIRNRFGKWAIQPASLLKELKLKETGSSSITMPGYMC